ncbi:hypothetical protein SLA_1150 [Streptomyces laurentii]|uniref:Uncharacterized protein n=1 Tax=Streptomyces laurentii TaxID=39478 RepID=A0A160NWJ2_STRLU|nr:hypothetical protein SLA_1150 [Streptomyces laurentii]
MRVIARRRRETTRWGYLRARRATGELATDDNAVWGHLPCPEGYGGARAGAREPSKIQKKGPKPGAPPG